MPVADGLTDGCTDGTEFIAPLSAQVGVQKLSESVDVISSKFEEYEHERQEKVQLTSYMKTDLSIMNERIEKLEVIVHRREQYSHHYSLLLHHIAENEGENTDDLVLYAATKK